MFDTDQAALLRAIAVQPDDDSPRRIFADWLEDHGESTRAEFIRVQCELASDRVSGKPLQAIRTTI